MKPFYIFSLPCLAFALFGLGCDPVQARIDRRVPLERLPSPESVEAALKNLPEIRSERYLRISSDDARQSYDQFAYESEDDLFGAIELHSSNNGEKILHMYCLWLNRKPPKSVFERTRVLMDKVYAALLAKTPELPSPDHVHETMINAPVH